MNDKSMPSVDVFEHSKDLFLQTFRDAYEQAGMLGLCSEGRLEAALSAVELLKIDDLRSSLSQ